MNACFRISIVSALICAAMVIVFGSMGAGDWAFAKYLEWVLAVTGMTFIASTFLLWLMGVAHLLRYWRMRSWETNLFLVLLLTMGSIIGAFAMYFIREREIHT